MKASFWKVRLLYWFTYTIAYRISASWGWKLEQRVMLRHLREHFPGGESWAARPREKL